MQNRLEAVKKNQTSQQTQLAEIRAAMKVEQAARPESVGQACAFLIVLHTLHFRKDVKIALLS